MPQVQKEQGKQILNNDVSSPHAKATSKGYDRSCCSAADKLAKIQFGLMSCGKVYLFDLTQVKKVCVHMTCLLKVWYETQSLV